MTAFLLLLLLAYIVAFFYTLNASIKNSRRLEIVEAELKALKSKLAIAPSLPSENVSQEATTAPSTTEEALPIAAKPSEEALPAVATTAEDGPATTEEPAPQRQKESFESRLGARWAVWAGGLALALGGIFLVKYSIESGLLSPGVRLAMAAIFGLLLAAAGEAVRRKVMPDIASAYSNAMIPGVLTAAGALTLFGVTYAAYGIYGYIGPTTAFLLLAIVGFATLGLSLLHGQALAGLGLLGSMATPLLISTESPNIWALFGYLTASWLATAAASRSQRWHVVPTLANVGLGLWALGYMVFAPLIEAEPVIASLIAMIAGSIWIWPGKYLSQQQNIEEDTQPDLAGRSIVTDLMSRAPLSINITLSMAIVLPALAFSVIETGITMHPAYAMAVLVLGLAAYGAGRNHAVWPAIFASLAALGCANLLAGFGVNYLPTLGDGSTALSASGVDTAVQGTITRVMGVIFLLFSIEAVRRMSSRDRSFGILWAVLGSIVPLGLGIISFVEYGNLTRDWLHAAYGLAAALLLFGRAYWLSKKDDEAFTAPLNIMSLGSFLATVFVVHTLTSGLATTILISVVGFSYLLGGLRLRWHALPFVMALACLFVLGRIAWEPTIVGPQNLGTTPLFNALLPGYGIPALLAIASAWLLRDWPRARAKNVLQAIASLMGLLTIAILVRHAMNGGVLNDAAPTLGEQSIYTLLTIGMSGVLMTLDLKSPSPIFRYGSMLAGVIAMFNVLVAHFFALNPYFTGENTGPWPFLNLLLIAYLMPAAAYGGLAWYARGKRPAAYVAMLALSGAALGFAWATLSVRRFWQGENIADWKGFLQGETYSYSVVWLVIGVLLLLLGSRFNAKSLRLASAALVLLAVAKAFLIDMSNLEGVLRALSFIGLGVVLIGIGLFYQKILTAQPKTQEEQG
ncbi:DUF2339 domain-containing protein [Agrobacterium sp. fls2-241-TYG-188a]|uniref:DUF2339 domain-containing protein n=1 Tax=Agrobacterium sp. fls2-241-TYG-188a TaxID=3040275 RepID=UPI00254EB734|nr:DUF2339 domain-containing protein [Agrobacterium sp. fls2-241-TYG-188a]